MLSTILRPGWTGLRYLLAAFVFGAGLLTLSACGEGEDGGDAGMQDQAPMMDQPTAN